MKPYHKRFVKEMNSGLHRLSTIESEVNNSANDEAFGLSFIVSMSCQSKIQGSGMLFITLSTPI